jgi:hypothetical protein
VEKRIERRLDICLAGNATALRRVERFPFFSGRMIYAAS